MTIFAAKKGCPIYQSEDEQPIIAVRFIDRVGEPVWNHLVGTGTATRELNHG